MVCADVGQDSCVEGVWKTRRALARGGIDFMHLDRLGAADSLQLHLREP
jgi:hypothetical protein